MIADEVVLITYENEETPEFRFFENTAIKNRWNIIRVGAGEKWEGFITRICKYREVCDMYSDETIIVFSDARDVFCLRPPDAFIHAFKYMGRDIVISADVFCDSQIEVPDDYKGKQCVSLHPYYKHHNIKSHPIRKFVNAGLMAGKVKTLRHMWQWIKDNKFTDDQYGVGMYMNAFPDNVKLDADAEIFHTSTFAISGGVYSIHQQKMDAPNFAELFGCGAFFLHIPANRVFKGQKLLYECVQHHLERHSSDELLKLYNENPPPWDRYGDLKKLSK